MDYLVHAKRSIKYGTASILGFITVLIPTSLLHSNSTFLFGFSTISVLIALIATAKYKGRGYEDFNYVVFSFFLGPLLLVYGIILYTIEKIKNLI